MMPPAVIASRARRSDGNLIKSGASKVSFATSAKFSEALGLGVRSGQASVVAMGVRISGVPSWASTEPSTYSTME